MDDSILQSIGNKIRVRACGICMQEGKLLLIQHKGLGKNGILWSPPGGAIEFGETIEQAVVREFQEETGLVVTVSKFLFLHEFIEPPLHSIELYFLVNPIGGKLVLGQDPEIVLGSQLISKIQYWDHLELKNTNQEDLHSILRNLHSFEELL